jgi:nitrilase
MTTYTEFTLAAIQAAPVYFDRDASTDKACRLIEEAAQKGATLAAFGETWLPGYPFFREAKTSRLRRQADAAYLSGAVQIPSPTTDRLCAAARRGNLDVVIGVAELDARTRATVYCTLLFIGRNGEILGRHRKLKPTYGERTIWGEGDASGLTVHERPYGRVSGLNCWEHMMLLPGYTLMARGTQIHVATWPTCAVPANHLLSQAFALQGGCYVIAVGALRSPEDVPERFRVLDDRDAPKSRSCIIAPGGEVLAEAPAGEESIVLARGSLEDVLMAKARCDVGGHYSRPDIFQLLVHRQPSERVMERTPEAASTRAASRVAMASPYAIAAMTPDNRQKTECPAEDVATHI